MIDRDNLDECILVEDNNGKTKIDQEIISSNSLPDIIKQSFGTDIFSNFMFRKNVIFVEGQSDKIILEKLLNSMNIDFWIFISHGDNARYFIKNIKEMYPIDYWEKNCFAIFDFDKSGNILKEKTSEILNKNNVFTLNEFINLSNFSCESIEILYDDEMYEEFCAEKAKTPNNDNGIKALKVKFAEKFINKYKNASFNEKTQTFLKKFSAKLIIK